MAVSTENIAQVKARAFPAGGLSDGALVPLAGLALVSWQSSESEKLFQVYVNGRWAGATMTASQRSLLVQCDPLEVAAIEVVSVDSAERVIDFSGELEGFSELDGCRVVLSWPRRGKLPRDSKAVIYGDGGEGSINYDEPIATVDIWEGPADKWGWGLDGFGAGDFGYSGAGAVGWGKGSFGEGEFGFDADIQSFESEPLAAGRYKFAVRISDTRGNLGEDITEHEIGIDPLPRAPNLAIESYDPTSDRLLLNIG